VQAIFPVHNRQIKSSDELIAILYRHAVIESIDQLVIKYDWTLLAALSSLLPRLNFTVGSYINPRLVS